MTSPYDGTLSFGTLNIVLEGSIRNTIRNDQTAATSLESLTNVSNLSPSNNQLLGYSSTDGEWRPVDKPEYALNDLSNVSGTPSADQLLGYSSTGWSPVDKPSYALNDLSNVSGTPSANQVLGYDGTDWGPVNQGGGMTLGTEFTPSGSSDIITGIQSGVNTIILFIDSISSSSEFSIGIELGDSGGLESTGYSNTNTYIDENGTSDTSIASGSTRFHLMNHDSGTSHFGIVRLERMSGNKWFIDSKISTNAPSNSNFDDAMQLTIGMKELSSELTQIKLLYTLPAGTDANITGGKINISTG